MISLPYALTFTVALSLSLYVLLTFRDRGLEANVSLSIIVLYVTIFLYPAEAYTLDIFWLNHLVIIVTPILLTLSILLLNFINVISKNSNKYDENEALRKSFHLIALILLIPKEWLYEGLFGVVRNLYISLGFQRAVSGISSIDQDIFLMGLVRGLICTFLTISFLLELLRLHTTIYQFPDILIRETERETFAAEFFLGVSMLSVSVFAKWSEFVAITLSSMIGDAVGALVGTRWGKHPLMNDRSLEGTMAEFLTAMVLSSIYLDLLSSFLIAITIVLVDIFLGRKVNDNLIFPVSTLVVVKLVRGI